MRFVLKEQQTRTACKQSRGVKVAKLETCLLQSKLIHFHLGLWLGQRRTQVRTRLERGRIGLLSRWAVPG